MHVHIIKSDGQLVLESVGAYTAVGLLMDHVGSIESGDVKAIVIDNKPGFVEGIVHSGDG